MEPITLKFGGYQPPASIHNGAARHFGDLLAAKLDKTVFVRSDARAKYGDVVAVVDEVRAAGVDQLGLLTDKKEQRRQAPPPPTGN